MRLDVLIDESIGQPVRPYAEYRLFGALSQAFGSDRVTTASLVLRRTHAHPRDEIACVVIVELDTGTTARVSATGDHPYEAINRAMEHLAARSEKAATISG